MRDGVKWKPGFLRNHRIIDVLRQAQDRSLKIEIKLERVLRELMSGNNDWRVRGSFLFLKKGWYRAKKDPVIRPGKASRPFADIFYIGKEMGSFLFDKKFSTQLSLR